MGAAVCTIDIEEVELKQPPLCISAYFACECATFASVVFPLDQANYLESDLL